MRLERIILNNFKQYYGEQMIEFSGSSSNDQSNVTVVYGENGRGKTTLYRSLLFGFYGDRLLEQDEYENNKESIMYLANLKALDEASTENQGIDVGVTIEFNHMNEVYRVNRYFKAIKKMDTGEIYEDLPSVELTIIEKDGNTKYFDEANSEEIENIINSILDNRVKNYFLFDGERIEDLTKASNKQKENIRRGIKNLLKIDNLFLLKQALEENKKEINIDLKKISSGELKLNILKIEENESKIAEIKNEIKNKTKELTFAENQKEDIDHTLKKIEEHRPILDKILKLEDDIISLKQKQKSLNQTLVELTPSLSVFLAKDLVEELIVDLEDKRVRGEVPSEIKTELIDKLLNEMSCICGRELSIGSEEYENLLDWKKKSNTQVYEKHAMKLFGDLKTTFSHVNYTTETISDNLSNIAKVEEQLELYTNEYELLSKKEIQVSNKDMMKNFEYRESLSNEITKIRYQLNSLEEELVFAQKEREDLEKKQKSLNVENELQAQYQGKITLVTKSLNALNDIIQNFEKEVKSELEDKANEIFKHLIDHSGSTNLKKIIVKENYTLDVLDWGGRPFLANISAGQRQIISLSFITALAEVAGGSSILEIPLFMDTPFGRLSPDHRKNLVNYIPTITPQWILLVTGSEFREEEEGKFLRDTGKWGKFYYLKSVSEGLTEIRELTPEDLPKIKDIERKN